MSEIKGVRKYIRRALIVDAIQWFGNNLDDIRKFWSPNKVELEGSYLFLESCDSEDNVFFLEIDLLDYIIRSNEDESWSMSREAFRKVYDEVNE